MIKKTFVSYETYVLLYLPPQTYVLLYLPPQKVQGSSMLHLSDAA